jgi:Cupin domain
MGTIGRRIVTGVDADGRSCILSDGPAEQVFRFPEHPAPGTNWSEVHWMWSHEETPVVPQSGPVGVDPVKDWFPGPRGTRLILETLGPRFGVNPSAPEEYDEGSDALQDSGINFNARYIDQIGVHSSDTIDYGIVISGRLWLEMTDGTELVLEPGDCVVQNGVRHTWRNRDDEPCQIAFIIIGAERTADLEADRDSTQGS